MAAATATLMTDRQVSQIEQFYSKTSRSIQHFLDKLIPFLFPRWLATFCLVILFILRIYFLEGYYVVAYTLGIYVLNLLIGFISPKIDPDSNLANNDSGGNAEGEEYTLPLKSDDEFRPFVRRVPEFIFWTKTTRAFIIADICTFLPIFNVPVFWPILLIYFVLLFVGVMNERIRHMIKHKYLPFTNFGKKQFNTTVIPTPGSEKKSAN